MSSLSSTTMSANKTVSDIWESWNQAVSRILPMADRSGRLCGTRRHSHPVTHPVNHLVNHPVNHRVNHPVTHPVKHPTKPTPTRVRRYYGESQYLFEVVISSPTELGLHRKVVMNCSNRDVIKWRIITGDQKKVSKILNLQENNEDEALEL